MSEQLLNEENRKSTWTDFLKNQSQLISREIGELKGSLMKAGQMLSVYGEHFLPPEANAFLKTLQSDSPPLAWPAIQKVLEKQLPSKLRGELEIEQQPIGSASLGQVHRARIKSSGEWLALKIQYPDVDKAINSDIRSLKKLLSLMKLIPNELNLDPLFEEVRSMLVQETNYEKEADLTEFYGKKLENDSRFIVPQVYRRYSNQKILATSFEKGIRADDPSVLGLSQERRDQLGLNFLELYFEEFYRWKTVQTDPHIGNYRVRLNAEGNDQIILFDFGATRTYPDAFLVPYQKMLKGAYFKEENLFYTSAYEIGMLAPEDSVELKQRLLNMFYLINEPFLVDSFDWKKSDLPQRVSALGLSMIRDFPLRAPPRELVFLDRKTAGVFIFLSVLQAKVSGKKIIRRYMGPQPIRG